jgi:hypothetical protein
MRVTTADASGGVAPLRRLSARVAIAAAISSLLAACSESSTTPGNASSGAGGESTMTMGSGGGGSAVSTGSSGGAGSAGNMGAAGVAGSVATSDGGSVRDAGPFVPNPMLAGLGDETALDLGKFDCTGLMGEDPSDCRKTTDYSGFVYDPHRHQMLSFGGGHATTMTDSIHVLDLAGALKWADLYPPTPCGQMTQANLDAVNGAWKAGAGGPFPRPVSTHTYDMLAVAPLLDEFLVISRNFTGGSCNAVGNDIGGQIAHFDRAAGTWSFSPTAKGSTYELAVNIPGSDPDPRSGNIVLFSNGGLSLYDPKTRVYTHVSDTLKDSTGKASPIDGTGYANHLVYFPPDDKFYFFVRGTPVEVYALTLNRTTPASSTVDHIVATGPTSSHGEPGYDYDAVNAVIGGGVQASMFYAFDPAKKTWTSHPMNGGMPGNQAFHAIAYDPVDNVFVFVTDSASGQKTWAYRLKR